MVYGDRRPYLTAILTLDLEETVRYAREHGITASTAAEFALHPQIRQLLEARVVQLNQHLAAYETIKNFVIAPTEFTPESGELTPTLKVKRKVVIQKYQVELDHLYEAVRGDTATMP
jgi:long-chain acyl-CoA synthetase